MEREHGLPKSAKALLSWIIMKRASKTLHKHFNWKNLLLKICLHKNENINFLIAAYVLNIMFLHFDLYKYRSKQKGKTWLKNITSNHLGKQKLTCKYHFKYSGWKKFRFWSKVLDYSTDCILRETINYSKYLRGERTVFGGESRGVI